MRIKEFCNGMVRDFAMASRARKVSGAFEKQAPGQEHCVVLFGKTPYAHSASLNPGV